MQRVVVSTQYFRHGCIPAEQPMIARPLGLGDVSIQDPIAWPLVSVRMTCQPQVTDFMVIGDTAIDGRH
jgi:hypothetical protein